MIKNYAAIPDVIDDIIVLTFFVWKCFVFVLDKCFQSESDNNHSYSFMPRRRCHPQGNYL